MGTSATAAQLMLVCLGLGLLSQTGSDAVADADDELHSSLRCRPV